jgi:phage baseplate assembly protein W
VADPSVPGSGPADFLGRGWSFPIAIALDDEVSLVADEEDIRQSIRIILETDPGERVMRPDFGAGLRRLVFEPINTSTMALVQQRVEAALVAWEPRINVDDVVVSAERASSGVLDIRIDYTVRSTNTFYNLVYPFYLQESR